MSEKKSVKPRRCVVCGTTIESTAKEIQQHERECRAAASKGKEIGL